ncbi:hypothetical protein [Muricoccus radiodurans]|uniref:hypothetical protein n=1 Tax=Muricoccus radiodurans TaxID=2231721 RepID=UPI003CEB4418
MTKAPPSTIKVNRAPVLTLWAAVVAERQGYPPETALSLASAVAGTAARAKARRLGLVEEGNAAEERVDAASASAGNKALLLGRRIPLTRDDGGAVLAEGGGMPAPAPPVLAYVTKAFGKRLSEVRKAMEALADRYEPDELNRVGFRLYKEFRPEVPADVQGWGAKGLLDLEKIRAAGRDP